MKPSQLRDWIRRYGSWGVLAAGGYLLLCHLRTQWRFALTVGGLSVLLLLGIGSLLVAHQHRQVPSPHASTAPPNREMPGRSRRAWQPHSETVRRHLEEAEQQIGRYIAMPPLHAPMEQGGEDTPEENRQTWAAEMLNSSLRIDPCGRVYADLGEFAYRGNDYENAVKQYTQALEIAPDAVVAQQGLSRSRAAWTVQKRVEAQTKQQLPTRQHLQTLIPFPVSGRTLWAALSCEAKEERIEDRGAVWTERENALITVFESESEGQNLRPLWRSDLIPSIDHRDYYELNLWAFPMTGNRIPELVFMGICKGGSANPSRLHIYRWDSKSFRNVLETESGECAQWITDLRHTGSYQVRNIRLLGYDLSHMEMIRWEQIYAWNGVRFVESDAQYPEAFHATRDEIQERLEAGSVDGKLWQYLGLTYLYDHDRRRAASAFARAEKEFRSEPLYGWSGLGALAEIRDDRRVAIHSYRQMERACRSLAQHAADAEERQYYLDRVQWSEERARHPHMGEISRE